MTCKDLIGYQLVSIDNEHIVIRKDNSTYVLDILEDEGDCCGYNLIETELLVDETELYRNPVITNVEMTEKEDDYDGMGCKLTFFGEYKPLAIVDTYSSSGSGWCYGACVSINCKGLDINEVLSAW